MRSRVRSSLDADTTNCFSIFFHFTHQWAGFPMKKELRPMNALIVALVNQKDAEPSIVGNNSHPPLLLLLQPSLACICSLISMECVTLLYGPPFYTQLYKEKEYVVNKLQNSYWDRTIGTNPGLNTAENMVHLYVMFNICEQS